MNQGRDTSGCVGRDRDLILRDNALLYIAHVTILSVVVQGVLVTERIGELYAPDDWEEVDTLRPDARLLFAYV